jgi:ABC-type uncharacterized transport system permease subunit
MRAPGHEPKVFGSKLGVNAASIRCFLLTLLAFAAITPAIMAQEQPILIIFSGIIIG